MLTIDTAVDVPGNMVQVTLTNAVDGTVHIESMTGKIIKNGAPIPSSIVGMSPDLPTDLNPAGASAATDPADSLVVNLAPPQTVTPSQALTDTAASLLGNLLSGGHLPTGQKILQQVGARVDASVVDATCTAQLDMTKVSFVADTKATWRTILRDHGGASVSHTVTVQLVAAPFVTPLPHPTPPDTLLAVQVVFDGGQTLTFNTAVAPDGGPATQTIKLSAPIEAFILSDAPMNVYTYRIDTITAAGVKQGAWTTDNKDMLPVVVVA